ncbi:MAG: HD domain-containing protein [Xanthobacteraceae bacterium]|nr:HD domain-containing protein [Xanthobacteraceae bacterium]
MSELIRPQDLAVWRAARPWLDVRSNDIHTLISYGLARALLQLRPEADENIVLPAVLMHDVGWKAFPEDKLAGAVGPNPLYPELVRGHEIEGARVAREAFGVIAEPSLDVEAIVAIIDGHDTRKQALSESDAVMKDADKLWRFTTHGVATIGGWFALSAKETTAMLKDFVVPSLLTAEAKTMAAALLAETWSAARAGDYLERGEAT